MLWNEKSHDFTNDCLFNTPKDSAQPTTAPNFIYGVISRNYVTDHFKIQQIINRLTVYDRRAGDLAQVRACSIKQ